MLFCFWRVRRIAFRPAFAGDATRSHGDWPLDFAPGTSRNRLDTKSNLTWVVGGILFWGLKREPNGNPTSWGSPRPHMHVNRPGVRDAEPEVPGSALAARKPNSWLLVDLKNRHGLADASSCRVSHEPCPLHM